MINDSALLLTASVSIGDSTKISYRVCAGGAVELFIGDHLDLTINEPALSNLVASAEKALREVRQALARDEVALVSRLDSAHR